MIKEPMLSSTLKDVKLLNYPVFVTPKLDGIRCLMVNGKAVSRKFKDIPNKYVQKMMCGIPNWLDGELITKGGFNAVQSAIMSEDGEPDFQYYVFDYVKHTLERGYMFRMEDMRDLTLPEFCIKLFPQRLFSEEELYKYEADMLQLGFEGIMIRSEYSPYKCGRSTPKEGYLAKMKRFLDSEAKIIGFEELMHNTNVADKDEFDRSKRSSHKANLIPAGKLGTLLVRDIHNNIEFGIGTGFDDNTRVDIWNNREKYIGKIVNYKYQSIVDKPRFPSWRGFRSEIDI